MAKPRLKKTEKNLLPPIILIIIGLSIISTIIIISIPKPQIKHEYFTLEPQTWIEENKETDNPNDIEINLFKATRGKALLDGGQEDYYINGDIESFFYYGSYKGNDFQQAYVNESSQELSKGKSIQEEEQLAENLTLMRITNIINPNDGIINGFILGKEESNIYSFYIFLDEDWKNQVPSTNILWGDDFENPETLNIKPFDFSDSQNGIYVNKLDYDIDWFQKSPRKGGIIVGEINTDYLLKLTNYEQVNITYMMVR
jgi:hypothetical protein